MMQDTSQNQRNAGLQRQDCPIQLPDSTCTASAKTSSSLPTSLLATNSCDGSTNIQESTSAVDLFGLPSFDVHDMVLCLTADQISIPHPTVDDVNYPVDVAGQHCSAYIDRSRQSSANECDASATHMQSRAMVTTEAVNGSPFSCRNGYEHGAATSSLHQGQSVSDCLIIAFPRGAVKRNATRLHDAIEAEDILLFTAASSPHQRQVQHILNDCKEDTSTQGLALQQHLSQNSHSIDDDQQMQDKPFRLLDRTIPGQLASMGQLLRSKTEAGDLYKTSFKSKQNELNDTGRQDVFCRSLGVSGSSPGIGQQALQGLPSTQGTLTSLPQLLPTPAVNTLKPTGSGVLLARKCWETPLDNDTGTSTDCHGGGSQAQRMCHPHHGASEARLQPTQTNVLSGGFIADDSVNGVSGHARQHRMPVRHGCFLPPIKR